MKNNDIIKSKDTTYRILENSGDKVFVVDCNKKSVPKWIALEELSPFCLDKLVELPDINDIDPLSRKLAYERFSIVARILPFIQNKSQRSQITSQIAIEKSISKQTIKNYLWLYLANQNITALAPKTKESENDLTADEKNIRWALNRYFYNQNKFYLTDVYTLMLKEKYCDAEGQLIEHYPTFNQFRYFYRKHKKMQNFYISRNGLTNYQRNNRPLLGNGIQEFANSIGVGLMDSTVVDIYLINDSNEIVGRPILTACVDAYSGLCCGYSLSWEGGVYSLRNLMLNVITDKKKLCSKLGIKIDNTDWNCNKLPATLVTDMGKEYASDTFSQLTFLGIEIINLEPYRPDMKGAVEKFFDIIQNLYKPHLKGKGVIEPDFQERGTHDYRKDACLTMVDLEKIIVRCIVHYNTKVIKENFPYTEEMLSADIKPFSSDIWNYGLKKDRANLIKVDANTLIHTLLPRCEGKFTRRGLIVNKLRYRNDNFTEQYLNGGTVTVAFNPEDVSMVWLIENGLYIPFELIESLYSNKSLAEAQELQARQKNLIKENRTVTLQAKIDLANSIETISNVAKQGNGDIKGIRKTRQKERIKTHIDYLKEGGLNG